MRVTVQHRVNEVGSNALLLQRARIQIALLRRRLREAETAISSSLSSSRQVGLPSGIARAHPTSADSPIIESSTDDQVTRENVVAQASTSEAEVASGFEDEDGDGVHPSESQTGPVINARKPRNSSGTVRIEAMTRRKLANASEKQGTCSAAVVPSKDHKRSDYVGSPKKEELQVILAKHELPMQQDDIDGVADQMCRSGGTRRQISALNRRRDRDAVVLVTPSTSETSSTRRSRHCATHSRTQSGTVPKERTHLMKTNSFSTSALARRLGTNNKTAVAKYIPHHEEHLATVALIERFSCREGELLQELEAWKAKCKTLSGDVCEIPPSSSKGIGGDGGSRVGGGVTDPMKDERGLSSSGVSATRHEATDRRGPSVTMSPSEMSPSCLESRGGATEAVITSISGSTGVSEGADKTATIQHGHTTSSPTSRTHLMAGELFDTRLSPFSTDGRKRWASLLPVPQPPPNGQVQLRRHDAIEVRKTVDPKFLVLRVSRQTACPVWYDSTVPLISSNCHSVLSRRAIQDLVQETVR